MTNLSFYTQIIWNCSPIIAVDVLKFALANMGVSGLIVVWPGVYWVQDSVLFISLQDAMCMEKWLVWQVSQ